MLATLSLSLHGDTAEAYRECLYEILAQKSLKWEKINGAKIDTVWINRTIDETIFVVNKQLGSGKRWHKEGIQRYWEQIFEAIVTEFKVDARTRININTIMQANSYGWVKVGISGTLGAPSIDISYPSA